jgi:peptidoglycan/LPS O-acetylase OafA/YrhL
MTWWRQQLTRHPDPTRWLIVLQSVGVIVLYATSFDPDDRASATTRWLILAGAFLALTCAWPARSHLGWIRGASAASVACALAFAGIEGREQPSWSLAWLLGAGILAIPAAYAGRLTRLHRERDEDRRHAALQQRLDEIAAQVSAGRRSSALSRAGGATPRWARQVARSRRGAGGQR